MPDVDETVEWKPRRETQANMASIVPAQHEVGLVSDLGQMVIGDGSTAGGAYRLPNVAQIQQAKMFAATAGGTANALTIDFAAPYRPGAYTTGMPVLFKAANTNTGATTINVTGSGGSGLGAKTIKQMVGGALADLTAGAIVSGGVYMVVYDGTYFQMVSGGAGLGDTLIYDNRVGASSTVGTSFSDGAWRTVPLTTEVLDSGSRGSLATNQITLAAGTYDVLGLLALSTGGVSNAGAVLRFRDVTNSVTLAVGLGPLMDTPGGTISVQGRFTLAGSAACELQIWPYAAAASNSHTTWSTGEVAITAEVRLVKVG